MRGILRRRVQRALDHMSHLRIRYCAWSARMIVIGQPFNAILHEATPPFAHRMLVDTEGFGNFLALQSLCTAEPYGTDRTEIAALCAAEPDLREKTDPRRAIQPNPLVCPPSQIPLPLDKGDTQ